MCPVTSGTQRGLLLGIPAIMLGLPLRSWFSFIQVVREGRGDFRCLYGAGWIVRAGQGSHLYDYVTQKLFQDAHISQHQLALPFNHLAYEAIFFVPFSYLTYGWAWVAFLAVNLALLIVSFRLLRPHLRELSEAYTWAPAALYFTFVPVGVALMQGQDSIILLTLFVAAYTALERKQDFLAGMLLGCGLFKFQFVLPVVLLFFLWRRWKLISGFAVVALALAIGSLFTTGIGGIELYRQMIYANANQSNQVLYGINPALMMNLRGLSFGIGLPAWCLALLSAIVILIAFRIGPSLEIAIVAASLVSYHMLIHDMSLLLIPALLSLNRNRWQGWLLLLAPLFAVYIPLFYMGSLALIFFLCTNIRSAAFWLGRTRSSNLKAPSTATAAPIVIEKA
jgi:hypothetical protein